MTTKTTPPDELAERIKAAEAALEAAGKRLANAKRDLATATEKRAALLERHADGTDPVSVAELSDASHAKELAEAERDGAEKGLGKAQDRLRLARLAPLAARAASLIAKIKAAGEDEAEAATVNARVVTSRTEIQQEGAALIREMQEMGIAETDARELPREEDAHLGYRLDGHFGGQPWLVRLGTESAAPEHPSDAMERIVDATAAKAGLHPRELRHLAY